MNEDSIRLLKEVNSGCKNATDSFGQVMEFVRDEKLKNLIDEYNKKHVKIGDECHQMLNDYGKDEKDPPTVAKAMMWFTTEVKMLMDDDDSHIAKLLADGCNMGMQSLNKYMNELEKAGQEEVNLASRLVDIESELYDKLMPYM